MVLEIAREQSISAEEKTLNINDVLDADEIFLTNSSMQVMPLCRVEKQTIGTGQTGPVAAELRQHFHAKVKTECEQANERK